VGLVTTGANVVLASLGFGSIGASDQGSNNNTGTREVKGAATFPVTTYVPQPPNAIPQGTVPSSGTPMPSATPQPTPTATPIPPPGPRSPPPCPSNCGGGGGGGCPSCVVTVSTTPTPWQRGKPATVNVHTNRPNVGINIIVNYSNGCSAQLNQGAGMTDGN